MHGKKTILNKWDWEKVTLVLDVYKRQDIVLVDFAEQAVKLIHPLFVFFYLFLLCGQFVSAFRKGGVLSLIHI